MVGQGSTRILLIEDEPLMRKLISGYLVEAGYVVRTATDGLDAIGKLRAGPPDLILTDLNMPRMSGLEVLRVVRARFPQIPVMVMSGILPDNMKEALLADAYIPKAGLKLGHLLQAIAELVSKPCARPASLHIDNKPALARRHTDGRYLVDCDDCLREFCLPSGPPRGKEGNRTSCVHCGKVLQYLVTDAGL